MRSSEVFEPSADKSHHPYFLFIIPAVLIINFILLSNLAKSTIGYLLFPYAQTSIKDSYHQQMNAKMCKEVQMVFMRIKDLLVTLMSKEKHTYLSAPTTVKEGIHQFRKAIDYVQLFAAINRELIEDDRAKKAANKKTTRYPITPQFVEMTDCL